MIVTLKTAKDKIEVLRNARKLKSVPGADKTYICDDLTLAERKLRKDCKKMNDDRSDQDSRSFHFGIRDGRVVRLQNRRPIV